MVAKALGHTRYTTTRKHYMQPGTVERVAQGKVVGTLAPGGRKSTKRRRATSASGEHEPFPFPVHALTRPPKYLCAEGDSNPHGVTH